MARILLCLLVLVNASTANAQSGRLGAVVHDTRTAPPPSAPAAPSEDDHDCDDNDTSVWDYMPEGDIGETGSLLLLGGMAFAVGITSPIWVPHAAVGDDFTTIGYFGRFPYDNGHGYMTFDANSYSEAIRPEVWEEYGGDIECMPTLNRKPDSARTWAARFRVDYTDDFHDMQKIGGHLLLSTSSRFGLDTGMSFFEERMADGGRDQLWLGDCNLIFRFAQNEKMQWRTGLGFNWLDNPVATNFGFNFTYGLDYFPVDPLVVSATLDWGTLGHAELFHFRTTVGVVFHGIEAYTGYEYYDIDRTQINSLVSGVRIWF